MALECYQYKVAGILVNIVRTRKRSAPKRRNRILSGTLGPNVYLIRVGDKKDSAYTLKKARERASKLALAQFNEAARIDGLNKQSRNLFEKTGCPF